MCSKMGDAMQDITDTKWMQAVMQLFFSGDLPPESHGEHLKVNLNPINKWISLEGPTGLRLPLSIKSLDSFIKERPEIFPRVTSIDSFGGPDPVDLDGEGSRTIILVHQHYVVLNGQPYIVCYTRHSNKLERQNYWNRSNVALEVHWSGGIGSEYGHVTNFSFKHATIPPHTEIPKFAPLRDMIEECPFARDGGYTRDYEIEDAKIFILAGQQGDFCFLQRYKLSKTNAPALVGICDTEVCTSIAQCKLT